MANPNDKSQKIEDIVDALNPSGRKRVDSIKSDICSWCGKPATEFKDDLSRKEYTISGFCQECQDKTFESRQKEVKDEMSNLWETTHKSWEEIQMY